MVNDIDIALAQLAAKRAAYMRVKDYYDGLHRLSFSTEKFRSAFGTLFGALADNLMPTVVDAVADRLDVTGFGVEIGRQQAGKDAWAIWRANRMDRRAGETHKAALTYGDAYLVVWPAPDGRPIIYPNAGPLMTVKYDADAPGLIAWAAKAWRTDDNHVRITMYYPDQIQKFITRGPRAASAATPTKAAAFEPYEIDGEPWPLPNPYGAVPVFHLANNADIGAFGQSELRDAIPMQDGVNKSLADMLVAMEFAAYPQRWATGLEVPIDEITGRPLAKPFEPGVDRFWTVASELAKFGQFDAANLAQFLQVQDSFRFAIARDTATPLHYFQLLSDPPSGEALKTLEARFVKKVKDRQTAFGNAWEDALAFALRIAGKGGDRLQLSAQWAEAAPTSQAEQIAIQEGKQRLGVSKRQSLKELKYEDGLIETMLAEAAQPVPSVPSVSANGTLVY